MVAHVLLIVGPSSAQPVDHLTAAEESFRAGCAATGDARPLFRNAAEHYAALRHRGVDNVALHRNEGNARFLAGDVPGAILAYRRGLRIDPDDEELRTGLRMARTQVPFVTAAARERFAPAEVPAARAWSLLRRGGLAATAILAVIGWPCVARWRMTRDGFWARIGGLVLVLAAAAAGGTVAEAVKRNRDEAVPIAVTVRPVVVRAGDGPTYPPRIETPFPPGTEASVVGRRGAWVRLALADGTVGWVSAGDVAVIGS